VLRVDVIADGHRRHETAAVLEERDHRFVEPVRQREAPTAVKPTGP
jgi:hypothetical protein